MYRIVFDSTFEKIIKRVKKKDAQLCEEFLKKLPKLERNPELGKPLRHGMKGYRRIHIQGPFVLAYEVLVQEVRLLDFDHHDNIYQKRKS